MTIRRDVGAADWPISIACSRRSNARRAPSTSCLPTAGVAKYAPLGKITINVKGVLFTVQKALPLLPDGASIILNASIVGSKGFQANSVYSATKAVTTAATSREPKCSWMGA